MSKIGAGTAENGSYFAKKGLTTLAQNLPNSGDIYHGHKSSTQLIPWAFLTEYWVYTSLAEG